ncbi:MAG: acetolactate synthase large subunit [Myxococcales bacterium]|nr:acetolactate synthase large subunit [Myxococcales bacterium]
MNGAESLVQLAREAGVEVCFANPGTTELPLVNAFDSVAGVRAVLGVFEGVCTGAADGYGRMADRPALTLLHLGPGFANGIANLHNARRARSPVVNLIGDHATWHRAHDAPLSSDIVSLARPVSAWVETARASKDLAADFAEALAAASQPPGQVATLIVPADCQWEAAGPPARPQPIAAAPRVESARVEAVARRLRSSTAPALMLGARAPRRRGLHAAARIAAATGARLLCPTFPARLTRGAGLPHLERLPYFPEQAIESLAGVDTLVVAGTGPPVSFFGYPGVPSRLEAPESLVTLAEADEDAVAALEDLAEALTAPRRAPAPPDLPRPESPTGALSPATLGAALALRQPEGAIVVDEGATSGLPYFLAAQSAPPHAYLALTGGAIGQGLPCATGAAVACPDRKVIALQADGSALYTLQALWTQAREGLDVVTLLCANRAYRILQVELARAGVAEPGPAARALTDLSHPAIEWTAIARGLGVPAARVETAEALLAQLDAAFREPGPRFIEAVL